MPVQKTNVKRARLPSAAVASPEPEARLSQTGPAAAGAIRQALSGTLRKWERRELETETATSYKSLRWLLDGKAIETPTGPAKAKSDGGTKRFKAGASQLARVLSFIARNDPEALKAPSPLRHPEAVAEAFGLLGGTVRADLCDMVREILRTERHQIDRPRGLDDPVMDDMRRRAAEQPPNDQIDGSPEAVVRAAGIIWEPIHSRGRDSWTAVAAPSFGASILRRAVGAIGLRWTVEWTDRDPTGFDEALDMLIRQPLDCHVLVGLYPTATRVASGVEFLPIPGLASQLSAIVKTDSPLDWKGIQVPALHGRPLAAIVMRDEAGHGFLRGTCQYERVPGTRLEILRSERDAAGADITGDRLFARAAASMIDAESSPRETAFFCADAISCIRVARELIRQHDGLSPTQASQIRLADLKRTGFRFVTFDPLLTPRYGIALAIRADARRLLALLRYAFQHELFGNGVMATAEAYLDLAKRASGMHPDRGEAIKPDDPVAFQEETRGPTPVFFERPPSDPHDDRVEDVGRKLLEAISRLLAGGDVVKGPSASRLKRWFGLAEADPANPDTKHAQGDRK